MASQLPWYLNFLCAGLAACTAEVTTLPIDTAKVRLQLTRKAREAGAGAAASAPTKSAGMVGIMVNVAKEEGFFALYKGFWPAIHRQLVFATLRVGLYGQITSLFKKPGEDRISLGTKVISGLVSGAIGMTVANPTDLVKVRFQSEGKLAPGQKPRYSGVLNAYSTIVKQEGLGGLWTGVGPAIARNAVINAVELASYDTAKEVFLYKLGMADSLPTHFLSGAVAGFMATVIGNPIDVVKTRVMAAARAVPASAAAVATGATGATATAAPAAPSGPVYTGALDCIAKTLKHEGPLAFYQGVVPQFFRITGWNIVMFVTFEQLKKAAAGSSADKKAEQKQ